MQPRQGEPMLQGTCFAPEPSHAIYVSNSYRDDDVPHARATD
eukprot:CAMPEP_0177388390 /NCGR_PEP_ID=MMETSP0368-20130122/51942_1 /TAXON_ID=447022 ORGANISM="Scrippsiella hangoei-like, Strain SHHI-4" /NCGR_SAMPLE_ID=MMETSP0368 /ASSEMBLY_ACC=CAM_ASM_000363 /LENGTH=41 /DNA_ID= /DNA_START= /DNA_END= /DNA_ORIENTATION=